MRDFHFFAMNSVADFVELLVGLNVSGHTKLASTKAKIATPVARYVQKARPPNIGDLSNLR